MSEKTIDPSSFKKMNTEQILTAAGQLPNDQLSELVQKVAHLAARRRCSSLPDCEMALLREINKVPDASRVQKYRELRTKRKAGRLSTVEESELLSLSDLLEEFHAERLRNVAELAQLRGLSLDAMMEQLGARYLINETQDE